MKVKINQTSNTCEVKTMQKENLNFPPQEGEWINVNLKKRTRTSPEAASAKHPKKQATIPNYWLNNPVPTKNSYQPLSQNEDETNENETNEDKEMSNTLNLIKSPPIFVSGVENITPLKKLLDQVAPDNYTIKILSDNQVKIQPMCTEKYLPIMQALKEKQTQCYTYQKKEDRNFRVVLKGIHSSTDVDEIKEDLKNNGHNVKSITNI